MIDVEYSITESELAALIEQHKQIATDLRSDNDRLREALREIVSKARTTGYGKPALATIAVAALAKEGQ